MSPRDISVDYSQLGARVHIKDCILPPPGYPWIERKPLLVLLPPNTSANGIHFEVISAETVHVGQVAYVDGVIPGFSEDFVADINFMYSIYPEVPVELAHSGLIRGYSVASLIFSPAQYILRTGDLIVNKSVRVTFSLEFRNTEFPERETFLSAKFRESILQGFSYGVSAKQYSSPDVVLFSEMKNVRNIPPMPGDDPVDMLIITSEALRPAVEEFCVASSEDMGISAAILTVESSCSNFFGSDGAESVRMSIQRAYRWWNPWVLWIVGDHTHVPVRYLKLRNVLGTWSELPSDLYFATVDGNLNANYDCYFGDSPADDLFPDMIYARLEVADAQEIQDFMTKFDRWLWNTPANIFSKVLMLGASVNLSGDDNIGALTKNSIIDEFDLDTMLYIYKLYSNPSTTGGDANLTVTNFIQQLRNGYAWINHFDHGNQTQLSMCMYCGGGILTLEDISNLENEFYPVFYSFSCDVNRLDLDNIARRWVTNPHGGGIAMLAHSEKAWSSERYIDTYLWEVLSSRRQIFLGDILFQWVMRLSAIQYEMALVGLCGSPLTPAWCGRMQEVYIYVPDTISLSDTLLPVIFDGAGYETPVFVGLSVNGKAVANWYSNSAGEISIPIKLRSCEPLKLFALGGAFLPMEKTIYVRPIDGFLVALDADWDVVLGDDNGIAEQGELVRWKVLLANLGSHFLMESVIVSVPDLALREKIFVELSPYDSAYFTGGIMPLPEVLLPGIRNVWLYIEFADGRVDSLPLGIGGSDVSLLWYECERFEHSVILKSAIKCNDGALVHTRAVFKCNGTTSDTAYLGHIFHNQIDTAQVGLAGFGFDEPLLCTLVVITPFRAFEFPLYFCNITPLESMWIKPGQTSITIFTIPRDSMNTSGYLLYCSPDSEGQFAPLTPEPITNSYFLHSGLPGDTLIYYKFRYIDRLGRLSGFSNACPGWTTLPVLNGFPVNLPMGVRASANPAVFDADGDGMNEIFVADQANYLCAFRSDGSDFVDITPFTDPILHDTIGYGGFWASVAVGDVDADGESEVCVVSRSYRANLWLLDVYGNPKPGFPIRLETAVLTTPALCDLDGDGIMEIVVWGEARKLVIVRANGTPYVGGNYVVENLATLLPGGYGSSAPAVGDFDGDGFPEIAVGAGVDNTGYGHLIIWNYDGTRRADFSFPGNIGSFVSAGNVDDDTTTLELLFFVDGIGIYAMRYDGTMLDGFPYPSADEGFMLPVVPADIDGDGKDEIIFQSASSLYLVGSDGSCLFERRIANGSGGCSVADIDGDGEFEILSPQLDRIVAYETDGTVVKRGFPLLPGIATFTTPYVCDVDKDGFWDVISPTYDSKLYIWRTKSRVSNCGVVWGMERGNLARTGVSFSCSIGFVSLYEKVASPFMRISPNPFNSVCAIDYSSPNAPVKLEIYDVLGTLVSKVEGIPSMGKVYWEADVPSGVYLARLSWQNGFISRRMIVLR